MYCRSSGYLRKVLVVPSKASGQVSFRKIDVAPRHTPTPIIDKVPKNTTGKYSFLQPFQCWPQGWWFCHLIGVFWQYSVSPVFLFVLHLHVFCTLICICVWSDWLLVVSCIWLVFAIWHIRTPIRFHQSSAITISNSADVWRKKSRNSDLFICDTHRKYHLTNLNWGWHWADFAFQEVSPLLRQVQLWTFMDALRFAEVWPAFVHLLLACIPWSFSYFLSSEI